MKVKRAILLQAVGLAAVVALMIVFARFFPLADWLSAIQLRVMHMGAWSAAFYPVLSALCNVLLLPGGMLSIGGGFFFGLWWGFLIILVGNIGGAALSFLISRKLRGTGLGRALSKRGDLALLAPAIDREGWKIVLLTQLHPLFPTSLLNYLYGLTNIRFRTCIFWVAVGQTPGLFLYAYIGTLGQLGLRMAEGNSHPRLFEYVVWCGGFLFSFFVLYLLGRIAFRVMREVELQISSKETGLEVGSDLEATFHVEHV